MAAFSGGVSACNFEDIKTKPRSARGGGKAGCFGFKNEKALRDRIKQFSIWYNENEDYKAKEYSKRRSSKRQRRVLITKETFVKRLRWLYFLTVIVWVTGLVMTFCSTVKSIGGETIFFKQKEIYRIVGPSILSAGVVLSLFTEGLKMNFKLNVGHAKPELYIIQTSNNTKRKKNSANASTNKSEDVVNGKLNTRTVNERKLFQMSPDVECLSIQDMEIVIEGPDQLECGMSTGPDSGSGLNCTGTANNPSDSNINFGAHSSQRNVSISKNFLPVSNSELSSSKSPKRKSHSWKRFHWTKLSQESTSSEFSAIDEHEALGSSGGSSSFRRYQQEVQSANGAFDNLLARQSSTTSRASTTSKYSNFSDDAPLLKR